MKKRNGWVSNSSSSSFIVSVNKEVNQKIIIPVEIDLETSDCAIKIGSTEKEIFDRCLKEELYNDEHKANFVWKGTWKETIESLPEETADYYEYQIERYSRYVDALKAGGILVELTGSNDAYDGVNALIYHMSAKDVENIPGIELVEER